MMVRRLKRRDVRRSIKDIIILRVRKNILKGSKPVGRTGRWDVMGRLRFDANGMFAGMKILCGMWVRSGRNRVLMR